MGCALALLGSLAGALAGLRLGTLTTALVSLTGAVGLALWSLHDGRAGRASKVATRFVPACGLMFAFFSVARVCSPASIGIAIAAGACMLGFVGLYKRRGPNRTPCASCPERSGATTCSGLRPIVRREKALMRKTGAMILGR